MCQVCDKLDHTADICFFRYNPKLNKPKQTQKKAESAYTAATLQRKGFSQVSQNQSTLVANSVIANLENVADPSWQADSGASKHVTTNPGYLTASTDYRGNNKVVFGNGNMLPISRVGGSSITSKFGQLQLNDVLCGPSIAKYLISVSRLANDNNVFVELYFDFCIG